jgi:hypothetical protein
MSYLDPKSPLLVNAHKRERMVIRVEEIEAALKIFCSANDWHAKSRRSVETSVHRIAHHDQDMIGVSFG